MARRAGRCATACWAARRPISTSSSTATSAARRAASAAAPAAPRSSSPTSSAPGAWSPATAAGRSTSRPLQGGSLEADLAARDLTVNAMAEPLGGGELVDPARRRERPRPQAPADGQRRRLRRRPAAHAARRAPGHRARLRDRPATRRRRSARTRRGWPAPPRSASSPSCAGSSTADAAVRGLALMDELGLVDAVLPELTALRGVEQSHYHHLDVHGHTLEVLQASIDLERDPAAALGVEALAAPVRALLAEPLADELTRGGALRFGALLHDIAKPRTRTELPGGRVGFPGHDEQGAEMARAALGRLRASERLRSHVAALTRHHLRLGFLVHEQPARPPRALPLPAADRAGRGGRHAAQRRRPARDARAQGRAGDRAPPRAGPRGARRGAGAARRGAAAAAGPRRRAGRRAGDRPRPRLGGS